MEILFTVNWQISWPNSRVTILHVCAHSVKDNKNPQINPCICPMHTHPPCWRFKGGFRPAAPSARANLDLFAYKWHFAAEDDAAQLTR